MIATPAVRRRIRQPAVRDRATITDEYFGKIGAATYVHLRYSTSTEAFRSRLTNLVAYGSDVASRLPASTGATIS